ncbi:MAG: hypothetical protein ACREXS_08930, partial [Gammaproteobacteria bacterium]
RAGGTAGSNPAPTGLIPLRRWADGFEFPTSLEGGSGATTTYSRDASRTTEGVGYALRDVLSQFKTHSLNENQAGLVSRSSWERFYLRVRTAQPTAEAFIWQTIGSSTSSNGARLGLTSSGLLTAYNVNLGVATLLGTHGTPLTLERRYRIDILVYYNSGSGLGQGTLRVYLDGVQIFSFTVAQASGGIGSAGDNHGGSELGNNNGAANVLELDFDDWRNSAVPVDSLGAESLTSIDWLTGHHSQAYYNSAINAATNWAVPTLGSTNQLNGTGAFNNPATARARSTTALARLNARSEYTDQPDQTSIRIGACASIFITLGSNSGSSAAQMGYSINSAAAVMSNITQSSSIIANRASYRPSGTQLPAAITTLDVIKDKSNDANTEDVYGLRAVVESIGTWSVQDDPTAPDAVPIIHNAYYPNTLYSFYGPAPDAPVFAKGGTYVGDGSTQNIPLPGPAHFIWIRPLTGGNAGVKWFGSGLGGNPGDNDGIFAGYITRAFVNSSGAAFFQVSSNDAEVNASGVTYQYIAFCDPGMRYNLCGAFRHSSNVARASVANALIDTGFTAIAAFVQLQTPNANSVLGLRYKGPAAGGVAGETMGGGALTNFGSFAAGVFTSRADVHDQIGNYAQTAYSLWRNVDGSGAVMVQILSYIGDGTASKVVTLTPTSGRFPLLAIVMPRIGSPAIMRDPSHTTNNSCNVGTLGNTTIGITAGAVDQITVGSSLNANLAVYDVFVIPGDTAGWNNGEFYPPSVGSPSSVYPPP